MREDLSAALKKVTKIASYLEAKAELGNELHEEDAFIAPPHLEAMAGILKESESVLWDFIAELPDDKPDMTTAAGGNIPASEFEERAPSDGDYVCRGCLTEDEEQLVPNIRKGKKGEKLVFLFHTGIPEGIWIGDGREITCARCGKTL